MKNDQKNPVEIALDHINLTVANFEETVERYAKMFGFRLVGDGCSENGHWGILQAGESMICFSERPELKQIDRSGRHGINHFGLRIQDRKPWEDKLRKFGVPVHYGSPVHYPNSTSWYIEDPTGHEIEVALWNNRRAEFPQKEALTERIRRSKMGL